MQPLPLRSCPAQRWLHRLWHFVSRTGQWVVARAHAIDSGRRSDLEESLINSRKSVLDAVALLQDEGFQVTGSGRMSGRGSGRSRGSRRSDAEEDDGAEAIGGAE